MTEILRYAAFTSDPAGGNPAGVVLEADDLGDDVMQTVAADVGYSETAFARRLGERAYALRYFSPAGEVAFCGHATLATAVAIAEREGPGELTLTTPAGDVTVTTTAGPGGVRGAVRSVATSSRPTAAEDVDAALAALGWNRHELDDTFVPHVAFAGNDHLVLAAGTRERLADLDYDVTALGALMSRRGWTTVQLVWQESDTVFHSRNPFPVGGVVEDPATGAAAAAFGGYLRAVGRVGVRRDLVLLQGDDMGRPSRLEVTVDPDDARVVVTGYAVALPG